MIRVQSVVLPILREALPGVTVSSWIEDVDTRTFPLVSVRRIGGTRHPIRYNRLSMPTVELSAFTDAGIVETEDLYERALEALYAAVAAQTVVPGVGYLHSLTEAQGATQSPSFFPDTWMVRGTFRTALRPLR